MRKAMVAAGLGLAVISFGAAGQALPSCNGATVLTLTELSSLFSGGNTYTCGPTGGALQWNELHANNTITEYAKGPTDPVDPSQQVGTYALSTGTSGAGVLTDSYTGGQAYAYTLSPASGTTAGTPGTYYFCPTGGGSFLTITVQSGHC